MIVVSYFALPKTYSDIQCITKLILGAYHNLFLFTLSRHIVKWIPCVTADCEDDVDLVVAMSLSPLIKNLQRLSSYWTNETILQWDVHVQFFQ